MMAKEPKRKVAAEYDKLAGKRVAIIVWADQATLDEDYAARYRVADAVRYYLKEGIKDVDLVDIRDITDFQEKSGSDWEGMSNVELGRKFKADRVVRIDLLEYTTRAPDAQSVRKGRVRASVAVYDVGRPAGDRAVFATEVTGSYPPEGRKIDVLSVGDVDILNGALRVFGEATARKFYEHEVSY